MHFRSHTAYTLTQDKPILSEIHLQVTGWYWSWFSGNETKPSVSFTFHFVPFGYFAMKFSLSYFTLYGITVVWNCDSTIFLELALGKTEVELFRELSWIVQTLPHSYLLLTSNASIHRQTIAVFKFRGSSLNIVFYLISVSPWLALLH